MLSTGTTTQWTSIIYQTFYIEDVTGAVLPQFLQFLCGVKNSGLDVDVVKFEPKDNQVILLIKKRKANVITVD